MLAAALSALKENNPEQAARTLAYFAEPNSQTWETPWKRAYSVSLRAFRAGRSVRQAWQAIHESRRRVAMICRSRFLIEIYYCQDQRDIRRRWKTGWSDERDFWWDQIDAELALQRRYAGEDIEPEEVVYAPVDYDDEAPEGEPVDQEY